MFKVQLTVQYVPHLLFVALWKTISTFSLSVANITKPVFLEFTPNPILTVYRTIVFSVDSVRKQTFRKAISNNYSLLRSSSIRRLSSIWCRLYLWVFSLRSTSSCCGDLPINTSEKGDELWQMVPESMIIFSRRKMFCLAGGKVTQVSSRQHLTRYVQISLVLLSWQLCPSYWTVCVIEQIKDFGIVLDSQMFAHQWQYGTCLIWICLEIVFFCV